MAKRGPLLAVALILSIPVAHEIGISAARAGSCQASVDVAAAPFRRDVDQVWRKDRLFMYVEVLKQFVSLVDADTRARIDALRGGGAPGDLKARLDRQANETAAYADSLERKFGLGYTWHYPVAHVDEYHHRAWVTLPVDVGSRELNVELGAGDEAAAARESALAILRDRVKLHFTPAYSLAPEFASERDYLDRVEHISPDCLPAAVAINPPVPAESDAPVVADSYARGRPEGFPVMGFAISFYEGPREGGRAVPAGDSSGADSVSAAAPAEQQAAAPEAAPAQVDTPVAAPAAPAQVDTPVAAPAAPAQMDTPAAAQP
jgi:hypothetical protein